MGWYARDYKQALRDFVRLCGQPPLPPRYAFGLWWSRYWAYSDRELKQLVAEFRKHQVPLDVLVVDMDWHLDGWTGYTWNPKYFPDPAGFLKWARGEGLRVTLNLHPADGVGKHEEAFPAFAKAMGLDPMKTDRVPFDSTDPRFMDAYFNLLHRPLEKMGVDFWWLDWQQEKNTRIRGLDPLPWLNLLHYTNTEQNPERGGRRSLLLSRWGGLGSHRYPVGFSGDTFCNWESLAFQPFFTATAANVLYGYWSHDIGGHQPGQVEPELYARWIQFGAFSPVLRTHGTKNANAERRIWAFPPMVFDAARQAMVRRYELLPYIYSAARNFHDTGEALCRPLYHDWPNVDEAYRHPGQYMFGPDLMVAPVTTPGDPVTLSALCTTWLPPGEWVNWFTGERVAGPKEITRMIPLDEMPLWVRAGAVIPKAQASTQTGGATNSGDPGRETSVPLNRAWFVPDDTAVTGTKALRPDLLVLAVYPGRVGECTLYEDDGETTAYQGGRFSRTRIAQETSRDGSRVQLHIGAAEGAWAGLPKRRTVLLEMPAFTTPGFSNPVTVTVNGKPVSIKQVSAHGFGFLEIPTDQPTEVVVSTPPAPFARALSALGFNGLVERARSANFSLLADGPLRWGFPHPPAGKGGDGNEDARRALSDWIVRAAQFSTNRVEALRLLGIAPRLEVRAVNGTTVETVAGLVATRDLGRGTSDTVTLSVPDEWQRLSGSATASGGLSPARPLQATGRWRITGRGEVPQTARIEYQFGLGRGLDKDGPSAVESLLFPGINGWWVIGPFDNPGGVKLDAAYPPEKTQDLSAKYPGKEGRPVAWKKVVRRMRAGDSLQDEYFVDLHALFGRHHDDAVAYALTYLHAPKDMDAVLGLGSDDGVAAWLNGREIHRNPVGRAYTSRQDKVPVRLRKGANTLLLKVSQGGFNWGFCAHVDGKDGKPALDVRVRLQP